MGEEIERIRMGNDAAVERAVFKVRQASLLRVLSSPDTQHRWQLDKSQQQSGRS